MVTPSIGLVVLVPFPFSDLSAAKLRPALIVASSGRDDWICVQITSNPYADQSAIEIRDDDFQSGSLRRISYARSGKLFTANLSLFRQGVGTITENKLDEVRSRIIELLQRR